MRQPGCSDCDELAWLEPWDMGVWSSFWSLDLPDCSTDQGCHDDRECEGLFCSASQPEVHPLSRAAAYQLDARLVRLCSPGKATFHGNVHASWTCTPGYR